MPPARQSFHTTTSSKLLGILPAVLLLVTCCWPAVAVEIDKPAAEDAAFAREVLPILQRHCADCHGADDPEAALDLSSRQSLLAGSESGYVVVPGQAAASMIAQLIAPGSKPHMPPEGQLSDAEIATIRKWIEALRPSDMPARQAASKGQDHWAFQPLRRPALPEVENRAWLATSIDAFILSRLSAARLAPMSKAPREVLIRRASLDLVGLPPTPDQVREFIADRSPDAYERLIDRLLASPAYGERWGRHWLDLARYADSGGFHDDLDRPHAWRYRDYVIASLNADKPYGQFLREQLAGDELASVTAETLAATAFCRNGPTNDDNMGNNATDREKYRLDLLDDVISTTSSVFLGLTVGCARCHDHKFDPLPQTDYYQLLAVFNSVTRKEIPFDANGQPQLAGKAPAKGEPGIMAIADIGTQPRETFVLWRGDLANRGPRVGAGVPQILASRGDPYLPAKTERSTGQRLALADWLAQPENPLTWRVAANRLWQHHFGRGIVATPSNFGLTGAAPTHPELLAWLAAEMAETGGHWKRIHRQIVGSATYRQLSQSSAAGLAADPQNLLLWRMNKRRLEAEGIRDSVLAVAGTLNSQRGGPGVKPRIPAELLVASQRNKWPVVERETPEHWRRSVYVYVKRQLPFPLLELFDVPNTAQTCDRRDESTVPTQALVLMNDQFTQEQAGWLAQRVLQEAGGDRAAQAQFALRLALCREPAATRVQEAVAFLDQQHAAHQQPGAPADAAAKAALTDLCHVLLNCNEFLYVE
ncbi:MAG: DUF1549 domain-containing protein [Pirellulaceae bacterium]|nr:DUF1549 domain-containing protein [Pirellulaceae bacterium]